MKIGHIIAKYRDENHLSQKDLAKILGISTSAVALWETESRNPTPPMLVKIADYFNISMDELFSLDRTNTSFPHPKTYSSEAERIAGYFDQLNDEGRDILMGKARELLKEQRLEEKSGETTALRKAN